MGTTNRLAWALALLGTISAAACGAPPDGSTPGGEARGHGCFDADAPCGAGERCVLTEGTNEVVGRCVSGVAPRVHDAQVLRDGSVLTAVVDLEDPDVDVWEFAYEFVGADGRVIAASRRDAGRVLFSQPDARARVTFALDEPADPHRVAQVRFQLRDDARLTTGWRAIDLPPSR